MSDLLTLAERCEREEPSRELDAAIARFLAGNFYEWWKNRPGPADFTTSLDAALTLVTDDCWQEITGPRRYLNIPSPVPNHWRCVLTLWEHDGREVSGWGASAALALCAAALRARAAMEKANG